MLSPIIAPDVGAPAAVLNLWFVQPGDRIYAGDRLIELLLESATFDVSAPVSGVLAEKTARPGEHLLPGQVLGWIEKESETF